MKELLQKLKQQSTLMLEKKPFQFRPLFFHLQKHDDIVELQKLMDQQPDIKVIDEITGQLMELIKTRNPHRKFQREELNEAVKTHIDETPLVQYGVWVYYSWLRTLVHLLDEKEFIELRTNRNRYKITDYEQQKLQKKKIGIIGLSVGQSIAITSAMERGFGEIRLVDYDILELSNLNRIRTGVHNLGIPKVIATAREIAEIDPFLKVVCYPEGLNEKNIDSFMLNGGKLDILVDECDSIDMKIMARHWAKKLQIPVIMDTSDRGLLDIERFDLEPNRPILHGLIGNLDYRSLNGLTNEDKVPYVLKIIGLDSISKRMKASLVEVEKSISTWPQLASSVILGGALGADICRRILLNQHQQSGRYYVDLEEIISNDSANHQVQQEKTEPAKASQKTSITTDEMMEIIIGCEKENIDSIPLTATQVEHLVGKAVLAPSGGNSQPWKWVYKSKSLYLFFDDSRRDTFLDAHFKASYMSLGTATENLVLAAHQLGLEIKVTPFPAVDEFRLVCSFEFFSKEKDLPNQKTFFENSNCDHLAEFIEKRMTNRKATGRKKIASHSINQIKHSAESITGAKLHLLETDDQLREIANIIGAAERMRALHRESHANMMAEIRWNTKEVNETRDGIDINTLELSTTDIAGLNIIKDTAVIDLLRKWKGGANLEKTPRRAIASASHIGLITMPSNSLIDYVNGGRAVQRAWLEATRQKVAFQPLTVVLYMFSRLFHYKESQFMPSEMIDELQKLRERFINLFPIHPESGEIFLFRLGLEEEPKIRSLRRNIEDVILLNN